MAPQVWHDFVSLVIAHPILSAVLLLFFTPPFFPIVKFFSPLLISTALFMLALFTMGPQWNNGRLQEDEGEGEKDANEDWTLRRDADDGENYGAKRGKPDGSWKDWVKGIEGSSLSWMSSPRSAAKLSKDWKNDETVSILEETWGKGADEFRGEEGLGQTSVEFLPNVMAPSELFKVDSGLHSAVQRSVYSDMELGEDTPELEDVMEPISNPVSVPVAEPAGEPAGEPEGPTTGLSGSSVEPSDPAPTSHVVFHQPMETLQIPKRSQSNVPADSPSTDLEDDSPAVDNRQRLLFATLKRNSMNANSGSSDADTPQPVNLSLSGKLKQMEKLGELLNDTEQAEKTGHEIPEDSLLKPTTAEQVENVKDQLTSFVTEKDTSQAAKSVAEAPTVAKPENDAQKTGPLMKTTDNGKMLSENDDSEIEIFPAADPVKMKLHPPVKLDVEQLEKKMGTSLSLRKGEISEVSQ